MINDIYISNIIILVVNSSSLSTTTTTNPIRRTPLGLR